MKVLDDLARRLGVELPEGSTVSSRYDEVRDLCVISFYIPTLALQRRRKEEMLAFLKHVYETPNRGIASVARDSARRTRMSIGKFRRKRGAR